MSTTPNPADRDTALRNARQAIRNTTLVLARQAGAQLVKRLPYRDAHITVNDVEPLAGMRTARDLELAARQTALGYIRHARESGHTWHQIGTAMHLIPGGDAQQTGDTIAEAAYTYAAGNPHTETARRYGRSFTWTCHSCDKTISDHGLISGPADDEHGHERNCPRHASAVARWEAEWEAEP